MDVKPLPEVLVLKGGTILDPLHGRESKGNLVIRKGRIAAVNAKDFPENAEVIDCSGMILTHGFCDLHVHFREPGREDKETLKTGARAALAGGFTRVCAMPNTDPPLDTPEAIRFIREKAEETDVYIHPIGAITSNQAGKELVEMGAMVAEGAVAFSDDGIPVKNSMVMRKALEYSTMFSVPIINHAEDCDLKSDGVMNEGPISTELGLMGIPDTSEAVMIFRDLELCRLTGAKLHIPHVSTGRSIELIQTAKQESLQVTAEVTPHHLFFNDKALTTFDTNFKVAPPIRGEADRRSLIQAILDETIDCIATDHAPHTIEEKEATFDLAPFGMIGLESCFGAVHKILVQKHKLQLMELIRKMTVNPRKILGFETDLFRKNAPVEVVVLDPGKEWTFKKENIYSRSRNTPFIGQTLTGQVRYTLCKGRIAIHN